MKKIFGNYCLINSGDDPISNTFNSQLENKILVINNELNDNDKITNINWGKHNAFITDYELTINNKHERPYETINYARCIYVSNDIDPMKIIDSNDRRFTFFEVLKFKMKDGSFKETKQTNPDVDLSYYDMLYKLIEKEEFLKSFIFYLSKYKYKEETLFRVLDTQEREEIINNNSAEKIFKDIIINYENGVYDNEIYDELKFDDMDYPRKFTWGEFRLQSDLTINNIYKLLYHKKISIRNTGFGKKSISKYLIEMGYFISKNKGKYFNRPLRNVIFYRKEEMDLKKENGAQIINYKDNIKINTINTDPLYTDNIKGERPTISNYKKYDFNNSQPNDTS